LSLVEKLSSAQAVTACSGSNFIYSCNASKFMRLVAFRSFFFQQVRQAKIHIVTNYICQSNQAVSSDVQSVFVSAT